MAGGNLSLSLSLCRFCSTRLTGVGLLCPVCFRACGVGLLSSSFDLLWSDTEGGVNPEADDEAIAGDWY